MKKEIIIKVLKVAVGSSIAIAVAEYMRLDYASSAGIITLLTIQNTKKDTLKLAVIRAISFFLSIVILALLLSILENKLIMYSIFMALMVSACYKMGWQAAISVNATVGGQALILEQEISWHFISNEVALVGIGVLISIILNLKMPDKKNEIQQDVDHIEIELKELLHSIGLHLYQKESLKIDREHISNLIHYIDQSLDKAFENDGNTLKDHTRYFIEYLIMRRNQCIILIHFYRAVSSLDEIPAQAHIMAEFLLKMAEEFNVRNNASNRMKQLEGISAVLEAQALPKTQNEFVGRAVLYQLVRELEEFLRLKKEFLEGRTKEQLELYW